MIKQVTFFCHSINSKIVCEKVKHMANIKNSAEGLKSYIWESFNDNVSSRKLVCTFILTKVHIRKSNIGRRKIE